MMTKAIPQKQSKGKQKLLKNLGKYAGHSPGRKKGTKNKFTTLKDAFLRAFQELGGVKGLVDWARKNARNRGHFYQIIAKMLPSNVDISGQVDIKYEISEDYKVKIPEGKKKPKEVQA